jgi:hypothetical protein
MDVVLSSSAAAVGAWIIAGVFIWGGTSKLLQAQLATRAMAEFGLIQQQRSIYGKTLGLGEIGIGIGLIVLPWCFALTATALLAAFTTLIGRALHRGKRFPCGCFGRREELISRRALGRTLVLTIVSAAVTLQVISLGIPSLVSYVTEGLYVVGAFLAAVLVSYTKALNTTYRTLVSGLR